MGLALTHFAGSALIRIPLEPNSRTLLFDPTKHKVNAILTFEGYF